MIFKQINMDHDLLNNGKTGKNVLKKVQE